MQIMNQNYNYQNRIIKNRMNNNIKNIDKMNKNIKNI